MLKVRFAMVALFALASTAVSAANFSFTGSLDRVNDRVNFDFVLTDTATVTMQSFGYGGGVNELGDTIPNGGFDTVFSLFDLSSGLFVAGNDDGYDELGDCIGNIDPGTDECYDSYLQQELTAGSYRLVLTSFSNFPLGDLADGFDNDGAPGFNDRSPNWAIDILNVDSVTTQAVTVPEPASWAMLIAGFGLTGAVLRRRRQDAVTA
jgi:hypothetical protein